MSAWAELLLVSTCVAKWIQNMQMHLETNTSVMAAGGFRVLYVCARGGVVVF